jgi:hypothetical protein
MYIRSGGTIDFDLPRHFSFDRAAGKYVSE